MEARSRWAQQIGLVQEISKQQMSFELEADWELKGQETCLDDAAAQEAGLASLLLQLSLYRPQLGKLGTRLALEHMLLCLGTSASTAQGQVKEAINACFVQWLDPARRGTFRLPPGVQTLCFCASKESSLA